MFETEEKQQRVLLLAVNNGSYDVDTSLEELKELAEAAGAEVVGCMVQNLATINNATYIGSGKLQEVDEFCRQQEVDLLIVDDELSGAQMRNIEDILNIDVIDRTILILDIFAMRALSNEGKLQVELAQQKYLMPRLIGMGKQLSRQGGTASGSIGSRGPGETKLESDRRHIRRRIESLERELKEMSLRRERVRRRRAKNDVITIAIVGYTNVGKSTLLNHLTDAGVLEKNQLFATLDPTARELKLRDGQTAILIDTVGFIQRLPHQLVEAFKSTLEEAASANLILNLCDASDERVDVQLEVTNALLKELGCGDTPIITVYNKCDKIPQELLPHNSECAVCISAKTGYGIDDLLDCIAHVLSHSMRKIKMLVPYSEASILDRIRRQGKILSEQYENNGIAVVAVVEAAIIPQLEQFHVEE